ncbi:MAG: hypothetical protein K6T75_06935 [Acetobacteraceae bacterium]|nr:hypothetical protein [Acetobacteraceae bacterium]
MTSQAHGRGKGRGSRWGWGGRWRRRLGPPTARRVLPPLCLIAAASLLLACLAPLFAGCGPSPGPPPTSAPATPPDSAPSGGGPALDPAAIRTMASILRRTLALRLPAVRGEEIYSPEFLRARVEAARRRVLEAMPLADSAPSEYALARQQMLESLEAAGQALGAGNLAQALELANRAQSYASSFLAQGKDGARLLAHLGDPVRRLGELEAAWAEREGRLGRLESEPLPLSAYPLLSVLEYLADSAQRELERCRGLAGPEPDSTATLAPLVSATDGVSIALEMFDHLHRRLLELAARDRRGALDCPGPALREQAREALSRALSEAGAATPAGPGQGDGSSPPETPEAPEVIPLESERHLRAALSLAGLSAEPRPNRTALAWMRACEARQELWARGEAVALEGTAGVALAQLAAAARKGLIGDLRRSLDLARRLERRGLPMAWATTRLKEGLELAENGDRLLSATVEGKRPPELGAREAALIYLRGRVVARLVADVLEALQGAAARAGGGQGRG